MVGSGVRTIADETLEPFNLVKMVLVRSDLVKLVNLYIYELDTYAGSVFYRDKQLTIMTQVINYGQDPLQTMKIFSHNPENNKCIVFIHGGAWRDPRNTYDDFADLIEKLPSNINCISLNYRLSPDVKHPTHLLDIIRALNYLQREFGIKRTLLVGHSVGATLILQLLTYKALLGEKAIPLTIKLEHLYFIDGIYSIPDLLEEYPSYLLFVNEAFASEKDYEGATSITVPTDWDFPFTSIDILQSQEDELLSERQLNVFALFLKARGIQFTDRRGHWGKHEEVYRRREIADIIIEAESN